MRILIQRVSSARVTVEGRVVGEIGPGLLAFVGFRHDDTEEVMAHLAQKMLSLRIFEDTEGKMNLSVTDTKGGILLVSQFTLYGDARKGNRPSFIEAAKPEEAEAMYHRFVQIVRERAAELEVQEGQFRAMMEVELVNSGPVTIILERCLT